MINNVNATMPTPFASNNTRVMGNRQKGLNLPTNFSTPNAINAVKVSVSNEAQQLFMKMQEGNGDLLRLPEFIEKETEDLTNFFSHENFAVLSQAHSSKAISFLSQAHFATGGTSSKMEFFSLENAAMAEMGHRLSSVINISRSDFDNFVALGNEYAEIRKSLEERYSGEELEAQLNKLSEAFDLTAQIFGHKRSTTAFLQMRIEQARIVVHNQLLNQNTTTRFFDEGRIEYDEEKNQQFFSMVTNGIRESMKHFAQLTRQFILENGAITTKRDEEALLTLLRSAPKSQGGFSFDNLNNINEILNRPLGSGGTPRPETMFTELGRVIQD